MGFIGDVNLWLSLILALLYLMRFRKLGWDYKFFTLTLVTYAIISQCMWLYVVFTGGKDNIFFFFPYLALEFITLTLFFKEVLKSKRISLILIPVLLFLLIQYLLKPDLIYDYNVLGAFVTHTVLITLSLYYMYKCLSNAGPFSLINLGIFVYLVPVTLIFVTGNIVRGDELQLKLALLFANIHEIVYLIFQILVFVEWWRNFYRVKTN